MSERKGTKALELWCKRLVKDCPNVHIENMTTSWRNGIAFCALVHHFRPDLIDLSTLNPNDIYKNNQIAFSIAEKELGIPALLDPEDMVENDVPDRLSILTYLSQFYQRLSHTVSPKYVENDAKDISPLHTPVSNVSRNFVKSDLDKCAICNQSVYLAQRLIVSHKLYHRRCFRCSKCSVQLSPGNCPEIKDTTIFCDACKNESSVKCLNNNDVQMGMLAFSDLERTDEAEGISEVQEDVGFSTRPKARPLSVLEKINLFERNSPEESSDEKFSKLSLKDNAIKDIQKQEPLVTMPIDDNKDSSVENTMSNVVESNETENCDRDFNPKPLDIDDLKTESSYKEIPDDLYKTNANKFQFLQTQLSSDIIEEQDNNSSLNGKEIDQATNVKSTTNVTDDIRISANLDNNTFETKNVEEEPEKKEKRKISIPPRLKKSKKKELADKLKEYPEDLNPFSDDDDEEDISTPSKRVSTNPFGSSDDDEDEVPTIKEPQPTKKLIAANPFWSDGEEPSSDEEEVVDRSKMYLKSPITSSTPNLISTPRKKKTRAPPPPVIAVSETPHHGHQDSIEDVTSIASTSSFNSTINSDKSKLTPRSGKKKIAPTPLESYDTTSTLEKEATLSSLSESGGRRKGPAPGLPLPERREVKPQVSPQELQSQLDLLETQQLGLERQGVLIEQMIRDKCEGDEACSAPQEEVEDLVIQLCELVNEKNDLFRKHTELMYIRRQQRLEQEQADIEHEIRVIQSRPAVNRMDSDKSREEQLVTRLVETVRLRDALVQQLDAERRRERLEDMAIADSIANKRAQRNSDSNTSSMKSFEEIPTPKKNKMKDKMKKQLKKAKHTLHIKKKDDKDDVVMKEKEKDKTTDKEHKSKWF